MTDLLTARPEDLRRAGAVLGQAAEALADGIDGCRRAAAVDWAGATADAYQERLAAFAGELTTARAAYDASCDAVLRYAQALDHAGDRRRHAEHLREQGALLLVAGGDPQALLTRARLLVEQADHLHEVAARQLVTVLQAESDRAHRLGRWERTQRFVDHAVDAGLEQVTATVGVARAVRQSLPGVGTAGSRSQARGVLGSVLHDVVRPWNGVRDLVGQLRDEQYAEVAGGALPSIVLWRKPGRFDTRLFGSHDRMHAPVLRALHRIDGRDPDLDRWVRTRAQRQFLARLEHFRRLPAPTIDELVRDGIDLVQQEALGGHTLLKHVGRDAEFLALRQRVESRGATLAPFSSFPDTRVLEAAIDTWLRGPGADRLQRFLASPRPALRVRLPAPGVGTLLDASASHWEAAVVTLRFVRSSDGSVRLHTAYAGR